MVSLKRTIAALVALVVLGILPGAHLTRERGTDSGPKWALRGRGLILQKAYQRWLAQRQVSGKDGELILPLGWSKGLSSRYTTASGTARLDPSSGLVVVEVQGSDDELSDVWLVDNQPGSTSSVQPEQGDRMIRVGRLVGEDGTLRLRAFPGAAGLVDFEVDLIVVTAREVTPDHEGILFGVPSLFQKLYRQERLARRELEAAANRRWSLFRRILSAPAAYAVDDFLDSTELIERGEQLFFNQTFNGNGRTCGTCHPAENNFALDPQFIATRYPSDPLFVAEFRPELRQNFENPKLMRQVGLILENLDGFGDLANRFTMRGVPHTLALPTSLEPAPGGSDGTTTPPNQRTGWSGDGAAGSGTLREFAIGAVTQHFPLTLRRQAGVDFRLPTDEELDALEAFQLSLGRQEELDLSAMRLKGAVPRRGLEIFLSSDSRGGTVAAGKCNNCHANAGATPSFAPGANFNFNTGVEGLPDQPADLVDPLRNPPDGGFGTQPSPTVPGAFGNGTFNTPPLVEAADTPPFFHNNAIQTIEEAVNFYNSQAFNDSPSGKIVGGISLEPTQVTAVAAFLRVINALESIRMATDLLRRAQDPFALDPHKLTRQAREEINDAIDVLRGGGLHPDALPLLKNTVSLLSCFSPISVDLAIAKLDQARSLMVE
jgi:cytochrome c peroxidase